MTGNVGEASTMVGNDAKQDCGAIRKQSTWTYCHLYAEVPGRITPGKSPSVRPRPMFRLIRRATRLQIARGDSSATGPSSLRAASPALC